MKRFPFAALFGVAAALAAPSIVFAQDAEPPALVKMKEPEARQRLVKIKYAPSALLAYMLDPEHNQRSLSLGAADKTAPKSADADGTKTPQKSTFSLPGDITEIISIDPQNVLLIKGGSDEDFRRLQELIGVLDQPLRQVEIEAQVVEIRVEDARSFGIDFVAGQAVMLRTKQERETPLKIQLGFVRNNFTARLNALVADQRAKIITAPRVTALNNLSATMEMNVEIGTLSDGKRAFTFGSVGAKLTITPTINGDDTVTLLTNAVGTDGAELKASVVANFRDGDTIALGGLSPLFAPAGAIESPNVLIFLTARIIRRAGDNIKVPGT